MGQLMWGEAWLGWRSYVVMLGFPNREKRYDPKISKRSQPIKRTGMRWRDSNKDNTTTAACSVNSIERYCDSNDDSTIVTEDRMPNAK